MFAWNTSHLSSSLTIYSGISTPLPGKVEKKLRSASRPDNAQAKLYPQGICVNHTLNPNDPQAQFFKVKKKSGGAWELGSVYNLCSYPCNNLVARPVLFQHTHFSEFPHLMPPSLPPLLCKNHFPKIYPHFLNFFELIGQINNTKCPVWELF